MKLVESAKRNGIRVIAIDSMALRNLEGEQRVVALNDFAVQKIEETISQAPGRYVIAAGKRHLTKSYSVDGFKERLGVVAIDVSQVEALQGMGLPSANYCAPDCGPPDFLMLADPNSTNTNYPAVLPKENCLTQLLNSALAMVSKLMEFLSRLGSL